MYSEGLQGDSFWVGSVSPREDGLDLSALGVRREDGGQSPQASWGEPEGFQSLLENLLCSHMVSPTPIPTFSSCVLQVHLICI